MRGWRVRVASRIGVSFETRLLDVCEKHLIVMGELVVPHDIQCDLQIRVPPRGNNPRASIINLGANVQEVVFANSGIRLVFKVERMPSEIEALVSECGMRKSRSVYMTV